MPALVVAQGPGTSAATLTVDSGPSALLGVAPSGLGTGSTQSQWLPDLANQDGVTEPFRFAEYPLSDFIQRLALYAQEHWGTGLCAAVHAVQVLDSPFCWSLLDAEAVAQIVDMAEDELALATVPPLEQLRAFAAIQRVRASLLRAMDAGTPAAVAPRGKDRLLALSKRWP